MMEAPKGKHQVIKLGTPTGDRLRLGFAGPPDAPTPRIEVYVGENRVARLDSPYPALFNDVTVDLPQAEGDPLECRIVYTSKSHFWLGPCEFVQPRRSEPNLLVFLIDTLRADHLSCYGYKRPTSPNIDAFARDAVRFDNAISTSSWTRPAVGSVLTGTYPGTHGARGEWDRLREDLPSLAHELAQVGYEAHGVMGNPNCLPAAGFGRDFFRYVDSSTDWAQPIDAKVVDAALRSIGIAGDRPWFLYVHALGPHGPYTPIEPYATQFRSDDHWTSTRNRAINLYDGEIAYTDEQFGRLIRHMKETGSYDNALIVVTADHGEEFWDHGGTDHGKTLYEEVVRVPLLVKFPGNAHAGQTVESIAQLVDIAPTILDVVDASADDRFEGISLLSVLENGSGKNRVAYASLAYGDKYLRTARTLEWKFLHDVRTDEKTWFNLTRDPRELTPLRRPVPGVEILEEVASLRGTVHAAGIHVLFRPDSRSARKIRGHIRGDGIERFEMKNAYRQGSARKTPNGVSFELELARAETAEFVVQVTPDTSIYLELEYDGVPVPPSEVRLAPDGRARWSPSRAINVSAIQADPRYRYQAEKEDEGSVFVWYVAPAMRFTRDDVDPQALETLRALGYV